MTRYSSQLPLWSRWVPALLLMVVIYILSSIPSQEMLDFGVFDFIIKKLGHMAGYALLGNAFLFALGPDRRSSPWLSLLLAFLYGVSDELHQAFVPGRFSSPLDVMIDSTGAMLGLAPWLLRSLNAAEKKDEKS